VPSVPLPAITQVDKMSHGGHVPVDTPQSGAPHVEGFVEPGFQKVADAFVENFRIGGETGAACAVYLGGGPVGDLWAGASERGPWTRGTRSVMFSVSKGITAVLLLMVVERGNVDLDAPVAGLLGSPNPPRRAPNAARSESL
jgi:CubicO group peptidase (beta-lactamase class C family)